jgi:hypothetical protein
MISDNYWNESWTHSSYPISGEKWVYLIAGIRNVRSVQVHGGLWANVGETTKSVEERLCGLDYARKAAGGEWVILNKWRVPAWISDKNIHEEIKKNNKVCWKNSPNSEEFLFYNDSGNGNDASLIIAEAIVKIMNTESEKAFRKIAVDREILKERLEKLKEKKERIIVEKEKIAPGWREIVSAETIWRRSVKEEVKRISAIDIKRELISSFIFSYVAGCLSVFAYFIFEPSHPTFFLIFLPVSSIITSVISVFKMKAKWDAALKVLKEKI